MRRGTRPATVAVAAMALVLAVGQSPAMAAAAAGSSYSAAGHQDSTPSGLTPVITPTGLAAVLAPVLTGVVNPLVAALTSLPNQLTSGVTSGLTGAGLEARNPANQQSAPSSGFPSCNTGGWTTSDCYGPVLPTVGVPPLLSIGTGAFQGFATGDATGYTARAQSSNPALSLLGLPIGNLGLITSSSVCPAAGSCSSTDSLTGMSLLGGAVTASVAAPGGLLQVSVNSAAAVSVSSLPTTNLGVLAVVGAPVTLSSAGTLLRLQIGLTLPQLLNGLGLSGLLAGVLGLTYSGTVATLTLTIGPGKTTAATTSTAAWGLEVGADLSVNLGLTVLGLAGVNVAIPTGIAGSSYGNLLDMKLAYTAATSGDLLTSGSQWIPPGLY